MRGNKIGKKKFLNYIKGFTTSEEANDIINSSKIFNEEGFNLWSFKKLIFLEYYIKPYLTILSEKYKCKCIFVDFFSSSGANKVEKENIISLGSPIVSLLKGVIPNKRKNINLRFYK